MGDEKKSPERIQLFPRVMKEQRYRFADYVLDLAL